MDKILNDIHNYICDYEMIQRDDRIVVGISGGADSVCLMLVLIQLTDKLGITKDDIIAVHINHMIRGDEADKDEQFVKEFADNHGIKIISYHKDINGYAKELGCTIEEAGRIFRYDCFNEVCNEYKCNKIAVAHNKNDLVETVIFNMIRGAGLRGMSGIKPVRDNIIRPLLNTERKYIEEYLGLMNQSYRDDSTNDMLDYDRNKIRHIILPAMEDINKGAIKHICQMAEDSKNTYSYIHDKALEKYEGYVEDDEFGRTATLDVNRIFKYNPVLQEHMIHEAICDVADVKKDITRKHVMAVVGLLYHDTGKVVELPYGIRARRSYDKIIISNKQISGTDYNIEISENGVYEIPKWGNIEIKFMDATPGIEVVKKIYTKMIDYDRIKDTLCLRTPEDGDYIVIDGKGKTKKLSRVFIDNKVDRELRGSWPVFACGHEIIWVIGLRYSEAYKIDESTKKLLYMECLGKGE